MKKLLYLILHCSATPDGRNVKASEIVKWHTDPVSKGGRGWKVPGYSWVIERDGNKVQLREHDEDQWVEANEITNGAEGYNSVSRHICYIGGLDAKGKVAKDTRTAEQLTALKGMVLAIIRLHPDIKVLGHNQVSAKSCPSFNVPAWLRSIGVKEANIY